MLSERSVPNRRKGVKPGNRHSISSAPLHPFNPDGVALAQRGR
jgi:hypothetical protein